MTYKCRDCGEEFDEPYRWVETHGFTDGLYESWSSCPNCESTDYDYAHVIQRELELKLQDNEEVDEEE